MRPTSPGSTGRSSSPITIVSGPRATLTRPVALAVLPFSTSRMPLNPLSDDPTASLMNRFGRSSKNWSLTTGENTAAVELMATSDDMS